MKTARQEQKVHRGSASQVRKAATSSLFTGRDKARLLFLTMIAGFLCVLLVISTAYAAGVKYEINKIIKENNELQGEIENLNVKIKSAVSISTVEQRAQNELGMVYPSADQYVYIGDESVPQGEMAMLIYDKAYN